MSQLRSSFANVFESFEGENSGRSPAKWFCVFVVSLEVTPYGIFQFDHTSKHAALNAFGRDLCKESLDLVQPGRTSWGEINMVPREERTND